ncbi:hybrid sensor histidine kinase/response regulator, partial [Haemophilus haemoglobinophilus]|nr:hybrid sensor histidine kinase/response regulator [Canicola haemoglobinophilus]
MKNLKYFAQKYVDWVIRLGRIRFSLLGVCILAVFALFMQIVVSLIFIGTIYWQDVARSIIFGLFSAPFVLYFFTLLV